MLRHYTQGNGPWRIWGKRGGKRQQRVVRMGWPGEEVDSRDMPECDGSVYSDRLMQWDFDKHDELCMKHFGNESQYWHDRDPEKISAFLSDYLDRPVKLVALWQYNNASSGFPVWLFFYDHLKED